ncbi:hypothetical protein GCM10010970_32590 [Silvimonas iriomotensis]|uniref:NHL repeat-containing protein n=1 Tax=Silvimonas iriomotensis TaxID=449662 RepID=A0ABQ2PDB1_9NEIS|nr:hypothetical protein GCM10010970_32590 [Silvimonas iriomotensis]
MPDGEPVILQNSNGDTTTVSANGGFSFPATMGKGAGYAVTITRQPVWASCSLGQQSGTVNADVSSIQLSCVAARAQVSTLAPQYAMQNPVGIVSATDGTLYMSDATANTIMSLSAGGSVQLWAGGYQNYTYIQPGVMGWTNKGLINGQRLQSQFSFPVEIALDKQGNIYVADDGNQVVRKIAVDGTVSTLAGSGASAYQDGPASSAAFAWPHGVAVDDAGNVYVTDPGNFRIRKIGVDGMVSTVAGSGTSASQDGTGAGASFIYPKAIAIGPDGNLYVGDTSASQVRRVTPAGVVTTLAGSGVNGFSDGNGTQATFNGVTGVAVDQNGTVYVSDYGNNAIRRISRNGVVTTLAGGTTASTVDGIGSAATFNGPQQLTLDAQGNLYVVESGSGAVRKISPVQ